MSLSAQVSSIVEENKNETIPYMQFNMGDDVSQEDKQKMKILENKLDTLVDSVNEQRKRDGIFDVESKAIMEYYLSILRIIEPWKAPSESED